MLIVGGINFVLSLILVSILGLDIDLFELNTELQGGIDYPVFYVLRVILIVVIVVLYYGVYPYKNQGKTYGKKMKNIKVIDYSGGNPSLVVHTFRAIVWWGSYVNVILLVVYFIDVSIMAILVNIVTLIVFVLVLMGLITIVSTEDQQGPHDKIFKTRVVDENNETGQNKTEDEQ